MKIRKILLTFLLAFCALNVFTQQDPILMVVNGDSISTSEFLRVYNKNLDLVKDDSQKEIDNYLQLFIEYQLKLNEARRLGLDKEKSYLREFENYKRQLTQAYLVESKVTKELVKEAYDRMKYDVKAVHILVRLDENERDTLSTYNKLLGYKERLEKEDFESLRAELNDGKTIFVEDLGYFSAFKMVYSFENEAYNTEVGQVSIPFRTRFGYHVVKVLDKRPSSGTMTAAHIMVANQQKDSTIVPKQRIQLIYQKLEQGESFESLAKQFSDDKGSASNGGELRPFKSGELSSPEFEAAVFSIPNDGEFSQPFETQFGWHIAKRIKVESLKDFQSMESTLENRVKRDSRSKVINDAMVLELKNRYEIYQDPEAKSYFIEILNETYFQNKYRLPEDFKGDRTLFTFNEKVYSYEEFANYLANQQRNYFNKAISFDLLYDKLYNTYFDDSIIKFREENLENESPEFAQVLKEYRDGLLLFELMEKEIWNKAANDSLGLRNYYDSHKSNYNWKDRVDVLIATSSDKKSLKSIDEKTFSLENLDTLKAEQMENGTDIIFTSGIYEEGAEVLPNSLKFKQHEAIYSHNDSFHLIKVLNVFPAGTKSFDEAKGQVTNDYQAELEKNWIEELKTRFPVDVDENVLNSLKTE